MLVPGAADDMGTPVVLGLALPTDALEVLLLLLGRVARGEDQVRAFRRPVELGDALLAAGDLARLPAELEVEHPYLGLGLLVVTVPAVRLRPLPLLLLFGEGGGHLYLVLPRGEEGKVAAIGRPARRAVVGRPPRETVRGRGPVGRHDPEVLVAVVVLLAEALDNERDPAAVRRDGHLGDGPQGVVVGETKPLLQVAIPSSLPCRPSRD